MNNFKNNLISHSSVFVEKTLIQFFFPLFMLTLWGKDNFNLWVFLFAIPSFLSIFQISISLPARNEMAILYKNKKFKLLNNVYQNSIFILLINILIILILFSIYILFNFDKPIIEENINIIFIILASTLISLYCRGPLYLALTYKGNYKIYNYFDIVTNLSVALLVPSSFYFFDDFEDVFYIILIVSILKLSIIYFLIDDSNIVKFFHYKYLKKKQLKKIIKYSLGFNFEQVAVLIKGPGLIFLIGMSNNLSLVGLITTMRTMFLYLPHRAYGIFFNTFLLEIIRFFKNKKYQNKFKLYYIRGLLLVLLSLFLFYLFSYFFGIYAYEFWLKGKFIAPPELIMLIVLDSILLIFGKFLTLPLQTINKFNFIGFFDLVLNLSIFIILFYLNIFDNIILVYKIIVMGALVNFILRSILCFYFFKKIKLF